MLFWNFVNCIKCKTCTESHWELNAGENIYRISGRMWETTSLRYSDKLPDYYCVQNITVMITGGKMKRSRDTESIREIKCFYKALLFGKILKYHANYPPILSQYIAYWKVQRKATTKRVRLDQYFSNFFSRAPLPKYQTGTRSTISIQKMYKYWKVFQTLMSTVKILVVGVFGLLARLKSSVLPTNKTTTLWKPQISLFLLF